MLYFNYLSFYINNIYLILYLPKQCKEWFLHTVFGTKTQNLKKAMQKCVCILHSYLIIETEQVYP